MVLSSLHFGVDSPISCWSGGRISRRRVPAGMQTRIKHLWTDSNSTVDLPPHDRDVMQKQAADVEHSQIWTPPPQKRKTEKNVCADTFFCEVTMVTCQGVSPKQHLCTLPAVTQGFCSINRYAHLSLTVSQCCSEQLPAVSLCYDLMPGKQRLTDYKREEKKRRALVLYAQTAKHREWVNHSLNPTLCLWSSVCFRGNTRDKLS